MNINLNDKVVFVTGVSNDLGAKICIKLAEVGAVVWAHQVYDNSFIKQMLRNSTPLDNPIKTIIGDLKSIDTVKAAVGKIIEESGKIDILLNYSELVSRGSLLEITPEEWVNTFEENLDVPFLCCQQVIPNMLNNGKGIIINFSSEAAINGEIGAHYAASKSALDSMTKGLSMEFKHKGIRVHSLSIPALLVDENLPDQRKQQLVEAITNMTVFLCSSLAEHINGETISIAEKVGI